jgi:fatty acid desaturase
MFPQVPWYNLPKLHDLIKDQMPKPNKGLISAYRDIIPAIIKQAYDPSFVPDRKLPKSV